MRLTTKTRYGSRAMVFLAQHYAQGPISSATIATHEEISVKYLESILAELRHCGLILSVRGAQGGHSLRRAPGEITLREVYDALEGSHGLLECTYSPESCARHSTCVTQQLWAEMFTACMHVLDTTTLADLVQRAQERQTVAAAMYYI